MIDQKTNIEVHAEVGVSVSEATLHLADLVPKFLSVIRDTPEYVQLMQGLTSWELKVITDAGASDRDDRWDSEEVVMWLTDELIPVLDSYAPEGYYFGILEGDGSDFGYWEHYED